MFLYRAAVVSIKQTRQREDYYILIKEHELDFQIHCSSINLDSLSGITWAIRLKNTGEGESKVECTGICCILHELLSHVAGTEEFCDGVLTVSFLLE